MTEDQLVPREDEMTDDMTGTPPSFAGGRLNDLEKRYIHTRRCRAPDGPHVFSSSTSLYIVFTLDFGVAMRHTHSSSACARQTDSGWCRITEEEFFRPPPSAAQVPV